MRFTALLLGVVLAILAMGSIATASTYYDIVQGLWSNITNTNTTWTGVALAQAGNNGWTYRNGTGTLYGPWDKKPLHGANYAFTTNLTDFALMGWEHSLSSGNDAFGWSSQTANGNYGASATAGAVGYICNSSETAEQNQATGLGTTVAFRNGWNTSYFDQVEAVWTASAAGTANVNYTCYSAAGTAGTEFQLGLYHNGVFGSQLGYVMAVGGTNTGVGNGLSLAATGVTLGAGDSIVLVTRALNGDVYGSRQDNGAASGGITFTAGVVPEPGSLLALGSGLIGLVGFAARRRK